MINGKKIGKSAIDQLMNQNFLHCFIKHGKLSIDNWVFLDIDESSYSILYLF